jgi:lipopolysaccharide/colanic/teichoic acid biosynthesis glycosyltransferase
MIKRTIDIFGAVFGLIILAPLFFILAVLVKLETQGPIFFSQIRVGLNGREFRIYKFRSMTQKAENSGPAITTKGDARITKFGAFLRKYKLDELPQLFNVLCGTMSLVGPRPEVPFYMNQYTRQQREVILSVKPGMTDYAAIELRDEEAILAQHADSQKAYIEILMPRKFALYEKYVVERNLWLDLRLIWKTLIVIVGKRT